MKSRILSIMLALSLIAVLFAAIPMKAATGYMGTVTTTDKDGNAKTEFLQGEQVYVKVKVMYVDVVNIDVYLIPTNGVGSVDSFNVDTDHGWYNSTVTGGETLDTSSGFTGDVRSYYVTVNDHVSGSEIARSQIIVRHVGLTLTPAPTMTGYWPGEQITITLVVNLAQTSKLFYVQVVNESGAETMKNFTDQSAATGYWSNTFSIGATWPDGTYHVNVRDKADNSFWLGYSTDFDVRGFALNVDTQRYSYLPGETASITYYVLDPMTLARISSGITIDYSAAYHNSTGNLTWQNGTLDISKTLWEFALPTNGTSKTSIELYSYLTITLTAKQDAGARNVSESLSDFFIGSIDASVSANPTDCAPGDTVVVRVDANIMEHSGDLLDGAKVDVTVAKNGTEVIEAYGATNLTTNLNGRVSYMFKLAESADLGVWNYIVKATVSKVGYSAVRETQFTVQPSSDLVVALDQAYYYGGQEATASFAPIRNNLPVSGVVNIGYVFTIGSLVLATGNTTSGSATVTIPESSFGTLVVEAFTHINGVVVGNDASAPVHFALLGLTSEKSTYRPGDTVVFQWTIVTGQASADLAYEVFDSNGVRVTNGTPAFAKTGSFEFTVPDAGPLLSRSYDATLRMTTPEGGFASDTASVTLVDSMELIITIGKSPYTSGEFGPGQKITIHYELSSYNESARSTIRLELAVSFDPNIYEFIVDSVKGTISYTIQKDAPMGQTYLSVVAYDAANGGPPLASAVTAFQVNNQVSGWDSSVGGISAIDLVLLILLIIVIIMLIVVPYMKDRMARPKPPEAKPMELTPPPPSEPGKTPPSP